MNIRAILTFTLLLLLINLAKGQMAFRINAKLDQSFNSSKVLLMYRGFKSGNIKDSVKISNNQFEFKGDIENPSQMALLTFISPKNERTWYNFVIDSGITNMILVKDVNKRILNKGQKSISNRIHETVENMRWEENLKHRIVQKGKDDEFIPLTGEQELNLDQKILDTLSSYPTDYYSLMRLADLSKYVKLVDHEEMLLNSFSRLSDGLKNSITGKKFFTDLSSRLAGKINAKHGSKIINFSVQNIDGSTFNNSSLKNTPYIIVFSATWCIPCQKQLPRLVELYKKYENNGLKLIYFNLDDNKKAWAEHVEKHKTDWINVSEVTKFSNSPIAKLLHISHVPTYLLIDQEEKIRFNSDTMDSTLDELDSYISKILKP